MFATTSRQIKKPVPTVDKTSRSSCPRAFIIIPVGTFGCQRTGPFWCCVLPVSLSVSGFELCTGRSEVKHPIMWDLDRILCSGVCVTPSSASGRDPCGQHHPQPSHQCEGGCPVCTSCWTRPPPLPPRRLRLSGFSWEAGRVRAPLWFLLLRRCHAALELLVSPGGEAELQLRSVPVAARLGLYLLTGEIPSRAAMLVLGGLVSSERFLPALVPALVSESSRCSNPSLASPCGSHLLSYVRAMGGD